MLPFERCLPSALTRNKVEMESKDTMDKQINLREEKAINERKKKI
jgi:hypothetical protein